MDYITVILPTKNRFFDLTKSIESILKQTRLPDQLLVVDQSSINFSYYFIRYLNKEVGSKIKFDYIYDQKITGLVEAKKRGVALASGDLILFLEDDVVLEKSYIEQIELGFVRDPNMMGCSGIITNPPNVNTIYKILFNIFHRGIFKDERMDLKINYAGFSNNLISSKMLSGGLSAWRREVFRTIPFDVANEFHMYEDVDFSTRAFLYYGNRFFINPNARLAHYCSPVNRDILRVRQRRKLRECFTYYKKRKNWSWALLSFSWLLLGLLLEASFQSFSSKSFEPIQGFFLGIRDGFAKKIVSSVD